MQAQEAVTDRLNHSLSNDYSLLRNVLIPGTTIIASLILIGPQGVFVLLASPARGVFRAKDDEWLAHSGGHFRPVRPSLLQARWSWPGAARVLPLVWGTACRRSTPPSSSQRSSARRPCPEARIILADAIERYACQRARATRSWIRGRATVDRCRSASGRGRATAETAAPPTSAPSPAPAAARLAPEAVGPFQLDQRKVPPKYRPRRRRARIERRQWILLGVMVVVEACILAAFAALVFYPNLLS
jgi:hypothetical protein